MLTVYGHPLSSYCWKAFVALRELGLPYDLAMLGPDQPEHGAAFVAAWPLAKMPLLIDGETVIAESSVIVEYGDLLAGGGRLIPADARAALRVRFLDRVFDNYVMGPMQALVADRLRPADARDPHGVTANVAALRSIYAVLEDRLAGRSWAAGDHLSLADCAAAPSLYYADRIVPLRAGHPVLGAYLNRLETRPSFARVLREMQPWWQNFPFADGPLAS